MTAGPRQRAGGLRGRCERRHARHARHAAPCRQPDASLTRQSPDIPSNPRNSRHMTGKLPEPRWRSDAVPRASARRHVEPRAEAGRGPQGLHKPAWAEGAAGGGKAAGPALQQGAAQGQGWPRLGRSPAGRGSRGYDPVGPGQARPGRSHHPPGKAPGEEDTLPLFLRHAPRGRPQGRGGAGRSRRWTKAPARA